MIMLCLKFGRFAWLRSFSALLVLVVFAGLPRGHAAGLAPVGSQVPDLGAFELEGARVDTRGKVVLLDFWASWCGPCKRSFPVMKELQEKFGSRGFQIVAVSVDEKQSDADAFLKKIQPGFSVLRDARGRLAEAMGVQTMPTSFLVGIDGKILAVHSGFEGESTRKEYQKQIESALKSAGK